MNGDGYKPAKWFKDKYCISSSSLRLWDSKGLLKVIKFPGGKRLYDIKCIEQLFGITTREESSKKTEDYIYTRVSSPKQKEDLERQIRILTDVYPHHKIIKDIGSGLNFKRQGLRSLLDKIYKGLVREVVVLHKDRLSRFAAALLEYIFEQSNVKFVVHSPSQDLSGFNDLADDLLAVTTFFVASHNGKRSAEHRRIRKREEETKDGKKSKKDEIKNRNQGKEKEFDIENTKEEIGKGKAEEKITNRKRKREKEEFGAGKCNYDGRRRKNRNKGRGGESSEGKEGKCHEST